mmetsp:Transcript_14786/g.31766  ORF Transcript_14786/g.31766 Transcript_14786/m.31766 type:complete len:205 (+) Transcript_14786:52-666(+)
MSALRLCCLLHKTTNGRSVVANASYGPLTDADDSPRVNACAPRSTRLGANPPSVERCLASSPCPGGRYSLPSSPRGSPPGELVGEANRSSRLRLSSVAGPLSSAATALDPLAPLAPLALAPSPTAGAFPRSSRGAPAEFSTPLPSPPLALPAAAPAAAPAAPVAAATSAGRCCCSVLSASSTWFRCAVAPSCPRGAVLGARGTK